MENKFASGESDPLADVTLAWKSLHKAQAMLQRIENKLYHQTWSCAKSQAARRKLWHVKSFDGKRKRDETALNEKKSNEIPSACRKRNYAALPPAWSQACFLEGPAMSSGTSRMTPLPPRRDSASAPCSSANREAVDGEGTAGTQSPANTLCRPRSDNFREQADSRGCTLQKEHSLCSLHPPPDSPAGSSPFSAVPGGCWSDAPLPTAVLLPTHHLSPASRPSDHNLEKLPKKSPQEKLEQLKKRIQEQNQKHQTASQEQKCLISADAKEPQQKRPLKRKVCKMMFAPDPVYKDQRERSSAQRMQRQRKPSPKPSVLERAATGKGTKLPGVSAWREGQMLARKLLGPPPTFPNLRSTAEKQTPANTFEPVRGFGAMPVMENSFREKGNEPVRKSLEFQSCVAPPSKPVGKGSNAPTKDTNQILRNLHLQSQCHRGHRHTAKGKAEVLQRYSGIHSPSPDPRALTPSAFSGAKRQSSLSKDGAKPSGSGNCSRGKSTSPQRQKGSSSPAQKGAEKENLKHPSKSRGNIQKPHPYSSETVQEFMYRKNEERKKKSLEEKKSLVQAMEMRNKRLQEVYRKQKEAIRKKTCSDQLHKLIEETASVNESPQCKLEQEQSSGGILERSSMAWVDKTSCTLLSRDHMGRNQLLETVQLPKERVALASPVPLESECWLLSPLKCEDVRDCSPPALHTPPLGFFLPQKDAKPYSKDSSSVPSPYSSTQHRVKAIHALSKELAEKVEMATKRLNATINIKDPVDKTPTERTWDLLNESSSIPEAEISKDERDRTTTVQMLLDTSEPDELRVSPQREFHGLDSYSLEGSTEGTTALDKQKEIPTPLPGGSAVSNELPWISHSTGQTRLNAGGDLSNRLQGFPVNKGSEMDISLLHEKRITSPASSSHQFLARSSQRGLSAQRNHYQHETILEGQNQEKLANQCPRESPRTLGSLGLHSPGAETHHSFEQDFASAGEGDLSCPELEEKHRSHLDNLRQTSLLLAHKLKAHQLQLKQQLTMLREKAKLELQESQRFLSELFQHSSEECRGSKGSYSSVPALDHAEQMWQGHHSEGDTAAGSNQETHSLKLSALKTERDHSPVDPKTVGKRKPLGGMGSLPAQHRELLHGHQTWNPLPPAVDLPHEETWAGDDSAESSEQASSDSQQSDVGWHVGGSGTFCGFSLAAAEQCLRGEELRARHQAALLELHKIALREKGRAELAWLGHQERCLEDLQDSEGASAVTAKQHKILMELKQEQAEIQHLQNIYRAAHQERKLLLKQQREILVMQHLTAQLQEKLHSLTAKQEIKSQSLDVLLTRSPATEEGIKLKTMRLISSPKLYSSSAESTAHPERPDLLGNKESCGQLKNKRNNHESFSAENKKTLKQYQNQTEEPPGLEQSLGVQSPDVSELVATEVCGAASQTTGLDVMIKDCTNTELNAQDHVLPLEHANSARMDDLLSTPITKEGRKCAFLESVLEEKALLSNPEIEPKDNEDINPCDSKFTAKGLGMLSILCNLCLVQTENTLQGTGDATSFLEDLEKESLRMERAHKEQRSHQTLREEQDTCSLFKAGKRNKDVSSDHEGGERRSTLISSEATLVKSQLRKERSSEEQRLSTDSERKLEITHRDEKVFSESPLSEVTEVEIPVPYEIQQVDSSQCLKHMDHISQEASDELNLKAFSEGLDSTESLSKSNNFSLRWGSAKSDSSLPEFQKVAAAWIDISESSISDSELELNNEEGTDVSIPEEFVCDNGDVFPNVLKETLIATSAKHHEHEVPKDDSTEASSHTLKYHGDVPDNGCTDHLLAFIPSNKANASKTKSADSSQSDNPAQGMDEPHLDASENSSRNKTCSQEITKQGKHEVASSSCSDDIDSGKVHEQQKLISPTSRVKKDDGINSLFVDQNRDLTGLPLASSMKHLDVVADHLRNTVSFPPDKVITKNKLSACLSSRNFSLSTSMPGISEEVHTETNSLESLQRVATGNQNNSAERPGVKEVRRGLFSSVSSKNQLFQPENCSSKGEDDLIFISDEGLPPTDEDTLSEILSPVDEVLSYGSAELPSSNKRDLSFSSEDLPPPPFGADAMKNYDPGFGMEDFPSPTEQMTASQNRECVAEDTSLKMDAVPPFPDNIVPEEFSLFTQETADAFSTQDGSVSEQSLVKDTSSAKKSLLEHQQGEHETCFQRPEFLPVSNPISSVQASKSPDFTMKQCKPSLMLPKAEDSDDPLLSFEIGDRVLVKQTQPGTLKFKGLTCFDSGHWAGVALDKAEGDNAGTYKGVKYFECAQHCGIFVRPEEISHLLGANDNGSNYTGDEDSDSNDDESFKGDHKYSEDNEQGGGLTEQKAEDTNIAGGSEAKENQSRLHTALLSGEGPKFLHSDQCKSNGFISQNNLLCLGSGKEKAALTQIKQRVLADDVSRSKNMCCLVEDQKRNKLADDIANELGKKLLLDALIALSETAQHKYKSAF